MKGVSNEPVPEEGEEPENGKEEKVAGQSVTVKTTAVEPAKPAPIEERKERV